MQILRTFTVVFTLFVLTSLLNEQLCLSNLFRRTILPPTNFHYTLPYPYLDLCGFVKQCGEDLKPPGYTGFIADGAWNSDRNLFYWVDVGEGSTIFSFDPDSCQILDYADPPEFYQLGTRGIAYNTNDSTIWTGDWHTRILHFSDLPECDFIDYFYTPLPIAGLAIDQQNQHLWVVTNESFDKFYEFDISTGIPEMIQGPIDVPWQSEYDGFDGAGLDYDQERHLLVAVNQFWAWEGNYIELFQDVDPEGAGGVLPAGYCKMDPPTLYGWGIALIDGSDEFIIIDNGYMPTFPGHIHNLPIE